MRVKKVQINSTVAAFVVAALCNFAQPLVASAASNILATIPFSEPDIANPMRGQYKNLDTGLFPQSNAAQFDYQDWPDAKDANQRFEWKQVQPVDPRTLPSDASDDQKYDFSVIDEFIARNANEAKRSGFRMTSFNSCCSTSYPANTNISVPAWLRTVNGATSDYVYEGNTHVIPNWNDREYLNYTKDLIAAMGRRYNKDERVAVYEMSGYGDFSENHNTFMRNELNMPGPSQENSMAELGYVSQYGDQYITKSSIIELVDATLRAFPDTQIIAAPGNAEIVKQLYRDSNELANIKKPVGNRSDCVGVYGATPTWAGNQYSYYVENNDPILSIFNERSKSAPIITEWCNFLNGQTELEYYENALTDSVNKGVSMMASTGFTYQNSSTKMPANLYGLWSRTNKYSGYRYAPTAATVTDRVVSGAAFRPSISWTNFGVAPTYDNWQVLYDVVNSDGDIVRTVDSDLNLKTIYAEQNMQSLSDDPMTKTVGDSPTIETTGLASGVYSLRTKVDWTERKTGATNTFTYAPMNLAVQDRDANGSYRIGSFTVEAAADTEDQDDAATRDTDVSTTTASKIAGVPAVGTPNTGFASASSALSVASILMTLLATLGAIGGVVRYICNRRTDV